MIMRRNRSRRMRRRRRWLQIEAAACTAHLSVNLLLVLCRENYTFDRKAIKITKSG